MLKKLLFIFLINLIIGNHAVFSMINIKEIHLEENNFEEGKPAKLTPSQLKKICEDTQFPITTHSQPKKKINPIEFTTYTKSNQGNEIIRKFKLIWFEGWNIIDELKDSIEFYSSWCKYKEQWIFRYYVLDKYNYKNPTDSVIFHIKENKEGKIVRYPSALSTFREAEPQQLNVAQAKILLQKGCEIFQTSDNFQSQREFHIMCTDGHASFLEMLEDNQILRGIWLKPEKAWLFSCSRKEKNQDAQGVMFRVKEIVPHTS